MSTLEIKDLSVSVNDKPILSNLSLTVNSGEIHALMGPNGNGKSTLLSTIMGDPDYTVTHGSIMLDGKDVLSMSVDQRSKAGIFLAMQYPIEIPGVTNSDFLKEAINARRESPIRLFEFYRLMEGAIQDLKMKPDLAHRFLNQGFSGGEKKRNEIVQMKLLKPSIAMLDETDSGLDVDALKLVADAILDLQRTAPMGMLVVSHYKRFYDYLHPSHVHVLINGSIILSGEKDLIERIDSEGYDWIYRQYGIDPSNNGKTSSGLLGTCATKGAFNGNL